MIAINLNTKTISIRSALAPSKVDERDAYIELADLWIKSPWLPGNAPFGFNIVDRCIFMASGWQIQELNIHGEIIRIVV